MTDTLTTPVHTPSTAQAQIVALDQVDIAPENLRAAEPADADIAELANTISAAGLLYPLLVRPGRKGEPPFMALDGRRRLLALRALAENGRIAPSYGVKVEVARDKALQAAAIVVSNTQRAPVHVADVIVAIGKLKSLKMTASKIAAALGYAEIEVKRLQCLAGLPTPALEALRAGRISLRTAKLLARVSDPEVLKRFADNAAAGYLYEHSITQHLNGRPGLDDPMFDLIGIDRYRAAGGRIDADLFGEFDDVVLDPDKLQVLWGERVGVLVDAAKARGVEVYLQGGELFRAPEGLEGAGLNAPGALSEDQRRVWEEACAKTADIAQTLAAGERHPDSRNPDLVGFLVARLEQERALHGAHRVAAIGLYPELGTGFEVQAYLQPRALDEETRADLGEVEDALDDDGEPAAGGHRPEIIVPPQAIDTEGRSHTLHETYTDVATRGLIRSVADDPMAALTVMVARLFAVLALQGETSTDQSASTLQARRYSRDSLPPNPALDGVVRERLEAHRRAYLASGLRPIPWVNAMAHGEKMELLAALTAISLDLREARIHCVRKPARAEAAEIAELTGHDITAYWTPDAVFLGQHNKAQLMGALASMEADTTPAKGLKKDDLVGYVASVAAEKAWAPPALNLRLEMVVIEEEPAAPDPQGADAASPAEEDGTVEPVPGEVQPLAEAA